MMSLRGRWMQSVSVLDAKQVLDSIPDSITVFLSPVHGDSLAFNLSTVKIWSPDHVELPALATQPS